MKFLKNLLLFAALCSVFIQSLEAEKIRNLPGQPWVSFEQDSGYIAVDEEKQRSLFYYFVEAETNPNSKPLVLWLNGGPGCSSVGVGLFCEHGPFKPRDNVLLKNDYSWNKVANMLYLESPAGVGFSYSSKPSFYDSIDDDITARDNLKFLVNWFAKFPQYKDRDFYITGESYGGHYVPQLALLVDESKQINLKGILIGNPLLDFDTDFNSQTSFMWSHGLISDTTFDKSISVCNSSTIRRQYQRGNLTKECAEVLKLIEMETGNATDPYDVLLDVCLHTKAAQSYKLNQQLQETYDIDVCVEDETDEYLNRKDVQEALHVNVGAVGRWNVCSNVINYNLQNLEVPMSPALTHLIKSGIRVFIFSGDQDSVIPFMGSRQVVNNLANQLGLNPITSPYQAWYDGIQIAGWTREYCPQLTFATIRGGSHEAPFSEPKRSLILFSSFLEGKPLPRMEKHEFNRKKRSGLKLPLSRQHK